MSTETKIEPCPFCGSQPTITGDVGYLGSPINGKSCMPVGMAKCSNIHCGILMHFSGDTVHMLGIDARCEGIRGITEKWNRRAVKP